LKVSSLTPGNKWAEFRWRSRMISSRASRAPTTRSWSRRERTFSPETKRFCCPRLLPVDFCRDRWPIWSPVHPAFWWRHCRWQSIGSRRATWRNIGLDDSRQNRNCLWPKICEKIIFSEWYIYLITELLLDFTSKFFDSWRGPVQICAISLLQICLTGHHGHFIARIEMCSIKILVVYSQTHFCQENKSDKTINQHFDVESLKNSQLNLMQLEYNLSKNVLYYN